MSGWTRSGARVHHEYVSGMVVWVPVLRTLNRTGVELPQKAYASYAAAARDGYTREFEANRPVLSHIEVQIYLAELNKLLGASDAELNTQFSDVESHLQAAHRLIMSGKSGFMCAIEGLVLA